MKVSVLARIDDEIQRSQQAIDSKLKVSGGEGGTFLSTPMPLTVDVVSGAQALGVEYNPDMVALSRRNTNVRSLALALGRKRTVAAQCEDVADACRSVTLENLPDFLS